MNDPDPPKCNPVKPIHPARRQYLDLIKQLFNIKGAMK